MVCCDQRSALLNALVSKMVKETIFPKKQFIVLEGKLDKKGKLACNLFVLQIVPVCTHSKCCCCCQKVLQCICFANKFHTEIFCLHAGGGIVSMQTLAYLISTFYPFNLFIEFHTILLYQNIQYIHALNSIHFLLCFTYQHTCNLCKTMVLSNEFLILQLLLFELIV